MRVTSSKSSIRQACKLSLNLELVDAHELIEAVVAMCRSQINVKQLKVGLNLDAARHYVKADSARLQQVFGNILDNATKFTEPNGRITVTSENDSQGQIKLTFEITASA